jgi:hypothetical protein
MFGIETSKCTFTVMEHFVDDSFMYKIQNNLAQSRKIRMGYGSLWFNTILFLLMIVGLFHFLYWQYKSTTSIIKPINIPKTELIWNNSIRNSIES